MPPLIEHQPRKDKTIPWQKLILVNFALGTLLCAGALALFWVIRSAPTRQPTPVTLESGGSMWRHDDRLGFRHVPSAQGNHNTYQFKVRYTIDEAGFRLTPDPLDSRGDVYILGCSWTFGDGVEDHESYPYLLGKEAWGEFKVRNAACMAWGTSHALLLTQEILEGSSPPRMILYGWLDAHAMRNYIALDWLEMMAQFNRKHPWFEIERGRPVFKGVVGVESGRRRDAALTTKEWELSFHLILEMNRLCRDGGVPFFVVSLPVGVPANPEGKRMLNRAREAGVSWVDLSELCNPTDFIPNDGHPSSSAHRKIAEAIAAHPDIAAVINGAVQP